MRFWIAVVVLLTAGLGQAEAQQTSGYPAEGLPDLARAPIRVGGPFATTLRDLSGDPILVIHYPWTAHARTSIEVSSLPTESAEAPHSAELRPSAVELSEVRPLYFFARSFKGQNTVAIYECQDGSAELPTKVNLVDAGTDYQVLGRRNALGKPSVLVASKTRIDAISKVVDRAVFCLLDAWAVDRQLLQLELPQAYFATPGRIRVWLLRGDAVIWSEDLAWPGFSE